MSIEIYSDNYKLGNYHLGQMFMDCMIRKPPDGICRIDAGTGMKETYGSVLKRSVRVARCFRRLGFQPGDVLALGGRNHLDLHIPYYAALMNGMPIVGIDPNFKYAEIKELLRLTQPKIIFCQQETIRDYSGAAQELGLEAKVVSFDAGDCTLSTLLELYDNGEPIGDFKPTEFDTDKVYAWLLTTSGTTGKIKVAAIKHAPIIGEMLGYMKVSQMKDREQGQIILSLSPVQWLSAFFTAIGLPMMGNVILQTSKPPTIDHVIDIINEYKPGSMMANPSLFASIFKHEKHCDLTCFKTIHLTGSKLYKELLTKLVSRLSPTAIVMELYGQTETLGMVLMPNPRVPGSCGVPMPKYEIKLVDPETGKEITEPHVAGEMFTKGPSFTEYYNNPEDTARAFTPDGFYKSGDLLYRDEENNYFYVDRLKLLIKCKGNHIMPPELEGVIYSHKSVLEVAVTSVPHLEDDEHVVACVVRQPGSDVTAQEIKDLVASELSASKQLRGGVVFLDELPKTSTGKVARAKLKELVLTAHRE